VAVADAKDVLKRLNCERRICQHPDDPDEAEALRDTIRKKRVELSY
jgi:hypothetical protein